jgi:hypothetical protein
MLAEELTAATEEMFPSGSWGISSVFQPLAKHFGVYRGTGNGNIVGLDTTLKQDSIMWLMMAKASTVEQEEYFQDRVGRLTAEMEAFSRQRDGFNEWRYLNYVNPTQDPLNSYGSENVRLMKRASAKYDPEGFFQSRVSGDFKISKVKEAAEDRRD